MILSQFLLIIFLCQWIISRYSYEKETLHKQLKLAFIDSEQAVIDSLILQYIVNPFIERKDGRSTMIFTFDSKKENRPSVELEDVLAKTYKIFIDRSQGLDSSKVKTTLSSPGDFDTLFLKNEFNKRLENYKLTAKWVKKASSEKIPYFYFESMVTNLNTGAEITKVRLYLLSRLVPNITFGLILLLLSGIAFLISYKSLKKQILLNSIRNDFVSNITHELNTPVSTVKVVLEALQKYDVKTNRQRADEYIQIAINEIERLDKLIHKVLLSSIMDADSNKSEYELLNFTCIVEDVIKSMHVRFENEKAQVTFVKPDDEITIYGERVQLQSVLFNLLDNSLKYTNSQPEIQVKLVERSGCAILTICDNGYGIPDEFKTKIFEKLFRVPSNNKHNVKGYGLGLHYAFLVVKKHQGSIEVNNNSVQGCTFSISIPIYKA